MFLMALLTGYSKVIICRVLSKTSPVEVSLKGTFKRSKRRYTAASNSKHLSVFDQECSPRERVITYMVECPNDEID